jgi:hypothetical protein
MRIEAVAGLCNGVLGLMLVMVPVGLDADAAWCP